MRSLTVLLFCVLLCNSVNAQGYRTCIGDPCNASAPLTGDDAVYKAWSICMGHRDRRVGFPQFSGDWQVCDQIRAMRDKLNASQGQENSVEEQKRIEDQRISDLNFVNGTAKQ